MNKKGMFFTILVIILLGFLIATYQDVITYDFANKFGVESSQIISSNFFVKNLAEDVEKGVYIASFRALVTQLDYITANGVYVDDVEDAFQELMMNGTLYGVVQDKMNGSTMNDWLDNFKEASQDANILFNMTILNLTILQDDPWSITTSLEVIINVSDVNGVASWNFRRNITSSLDITGFEDPVYTLNTAGRLLRNIKPSNYSVWNVTTTKDMLITKSYRVSSEAPSYFMRLEGNLSSADNGIETFVDIQEIVDAGLPLLVYNNSVVDYIYWNSVNTAEYKIHGITDTGYPYFKLDNESVYRYNLTSEKY